MRSPFAAADGVLARWHPVDLAAVVIEELVRRAGVETGGIDEVFVGCDEPVGAQGANLARAIVLAAGWPETVQGTVVEAVPHSGMSALAAARDAVISGRVRTAVVLGVSSASMVQPGASALGRTYGRPWGDRPAARYEDLGGLVPPVVAADRAATAAGIDRAAQERWALESIKRREASRPDAVVAIGARPGDSVAVQRDTPVNSDAIRSVPLDELEPMFEVDGTTTAVSFAAPADGVAALLIGDVGHQIGEVADVSFGAGSPFDIAGPADRATAKDVGPLDRLDLAAASASMALTALDSLGIGADKADLDGGTVAVGDAAAAEDLRLVVDGLTASQAGAGGVSLRVSVGAAAAARWRRL